MQKIKGRIKTWDTSNEVFSGQRTFLMGISIILIIIFHYMDDCRIYNQNYGAVAQWWKEWISSSSVDAFVFFSGFGLFYSMKKDENIKSFYKKRMIKLVLPYIIISFPGLVWRDIFVEGQGVSYFLKDTFFVTFFTQGRTWFWYVGFCIFVYAFFPYIYRFVSADLGEKESDKRVFDEMKLLVFFSVITVIAVVWSSVNATFFVYTNIALLRLPFFVFGALVGKSAYNKRNSFYKWLVLLLFALFFRYMDTRMSFHSIIMRRYSIGLLNVAACFFVAILFSRLKLKPFRWLVEWCGKHTLELYLSHVLIRNVLNIKELYTYQLKYEAVVVVSAIVIAFVTQHITNFITAKMFYKKRVSNSAP